METLDLRGAAAFLKMHPEEVRRRARLGQLPGAKAGKRWVFIVEDLAAYLRSLYSPMRQALRVTLRKEVEDCHSTNAVARGGFDSPLRAASELDALLGLPTRPKLKSCTTA
ncbi:MAG TPA: helix-turn-helix domain-containing protein [Burkholderiales bacterium]|nr:helix-turn-helix domain-containing protein [Burkholderiales bacterium]